MRKLVIGDIHGNYKGLLACLERSRFNNKVDVLISLGDIVDGSAQVFECVEELLKIKNLIPIKGNHDEWFREFFETGYHPAQWTYGGKATLESYSRRVDKSHLIKASGSGFKTALNPRDIPERHQQFFRDQCLYHIDRDNNLFVHAGFNRRLPFKKQPIENYYWDRELWAEALQWQIDKTYNPAIEPFRMVTEFKEIFIGHTQTMYWNTDQPMRAANIINIDTGARHNGRLTIMDVDTKQYWQSDPLFDK